MDLLAFDLQDDSEIAAASKAQTPAFEMDSDQEARATRAYDRATLPGHLERQEEILSPGDACGDCGDVRKPPGAHGEAFSAIGPRTLDERGSGRPPRPNFGETASTRSHAGS